MAFWHVRVARQRLRLADEGFTIIEVVAALAIIAVAFAALTTVFWAGLRTAGVSSIRSRGTAVATRETEAIRAVPYGEIGFYADQAGYVSSFGGSPTAKLADTTPAGLTPRLQPVGTVTVGPKTFDVARYITLVDASDGSSTFTMAYKKTTVIVTWRDDGGQHTIRQDSIVYPGGLGPVTTAPPATVTTIATPPSAPTLNSVTVPDAPAGETELDVNWSAGGGIGVSYFVVERATNNAFTTGFASSPQQPATATTYQAASLASTTTYYFRVRAYGANGLDAVSNVLSNTTRTPPAAVCSVSSLTVTGVDSHSTTKTYLKNNGKMNEDLSLSLAASSACSGTTFRIRSYLNSPTSADVDSPWTPTPITGLNRSADVHAVDNVWPVGIHTFEVVTSSNASLSPAVTKTFLVCADSNNHSTNPNAC
jgi:prepilin-type N-terminal cleavage/methylation domain-containing protein